MFFKNQIVNTMPHMSTHETRISTVPCKIYTEILFVKAYLYKLIFTLNYKGGLFSESFLPWSFLQ